MHTEQERSDELLELQRRGLELAVREADQRRAEIDAILSSRRVLRMARADPGVRDARLEILEALTQTSYPSATVLAAARHLSTRATSPGLRRATRRTSARRLSRGWLPVAATGWAAAFSLLASGVGESAVGAHFTTTRLLVWAIFGAGSVAGVRGATWIRRHVRFVRADELEAWPAADSRLEGCPEARRDQPLPA